MDEARQQLIEQLFIEAVELRDSGADRPQLDRLLDQRCGHDAALRAEVESLLGAHGGGDGVLDRADLVLAGTIAHTAGGTRQAGRSPWHEPTLQPGTVLGGYVIQRVLGSGGMGVVYVAQQERPRRTVALKVIRPAMTSPAMLKRFEAEAEILGRLHHPGIAQIYEAGLSDGRPFLAMELVDGPSLIEHAERRNLNTRERLELAARVCDAVQHAHQKGVIHRDLKPSNILVEAAYSPDTPHDSSNELTAVGQPKVLDFGVARATDSDMQVSTLRTTVGQLIGTLPYMSPEQVAGDQDEVDTRSDVYALGVILYQLLAGKLPHDVSSRSIPEAARVIRDEHPSRLSAVSRVFRGDIETIVAKAMDKERHRRYQSAAELRDDLRRFLAGEPIAAKRDSALYLLRTQLRRYKGTVAAAAAFVLLLLAFSAYSASQAATNARLARSLAVELSASNIERGRTLSLAGAAAVGENILWRELLQHPDSRHARWALWEHYLNRPVRQSIRENGVHASAIVISADGSIAALRSQTGTVQVWTGDLTRLLHTFVMSDDSTLAMALSPDASALLVCGRGGTLRVFDPRRGTELPPLPVEGSTPHSAIFSPDGERLFCGFADGSVAAWSWPSRELQRRWRAHPGPVWNLSLSPDSALLASCGREPAALIWSTRTLSRLAVVRTESPEVRDVQLAADGRILITSGSDAAIGVYSTADGSRLGSLPTELRAVHSIALSADESTLIAAGSGAIEVWDMATLSLRTNLTHGDGADYRITLHPVSGAIITTGSTGRLQLWDSALQLCASPLIQEHGGWVIGLAASPDGSKLVTTDLANGARILDLVTGSEVAYRRDFIGPPRSPRVSPDGSLVALGVGQGTLSLCSMDSLATKQRLQHDTPGQVVSIAWSPDGRSLVSGTIDGDAIVWDLATGKRLAHLQVPQTGAPRGEPAGTTAKPALGPLTGRILSAAWSDDGRYIALCATNPMVSVWDTRTFQPVLSVPGEYTAWCAAFSPDSTTLAVAMPTRELALYDTATWEQRAMLEGHSKPVLTVTFSPDGTLLASSSADGTIRLWDPILYTDRRGEGTPGTGRHLATLTPGLAEVSRVLFSTDGRKLFSAGADHRVLVWDLHYYDRHIAGNLRLNMDRFLPRLSPRPDTAGLEAWAKDVLSAEAPPQPVAR